jgi:hypothetical protein
MLPVLVPGCGGDNGVVLLMGMCGMCFAGTVPSSARCWSC